ncbi:hypothetical protein N7504_006270 [Penicillium tannophilum]|nr:hypothetical protein N7504_006270 [Penicillium tannophilum]
MKFTLAGAAFVFSTLGTAVSHSTSTVGNNFQNQGQSEIRFPVPSSMTVEQARSKCGDQAQLSCCNKAIYAGDTTTVNSGALGGLLSHLIGTGSGADGLGLCVLSSMLEAFLGPLISAQDILNQHCKQNIACCTNSPSNVDDDGIGAGLPCMALGAIF